jgi:hypothetical protein
MRPFSALLPTRQDLLPLCSGFLMLLFATGVVTFFVEAKPYSRPVQQPIQFNHKKHVEDAGLECSTCHGQYSTETSAGFPGADACALCHTEPQGKSAAEAALVARLKAGQPLEWVSVFREPPHVFFSHRRHVVVAKLECTLCHGNIGLSSAPPDRTAQLRMVQCVGCHATHAASTNCSACHR